MKNCVSIILLLFFFLSLSATFLLFDIQNSLLNPQNIKTALYENDSYESFVNKTLPSILSETFKENSEATIPAGLLGDIAKKIIEPSALKSDVELALDQILPYIDGKSGDVNFKIDLQKYKKNVSTNFKPTIIAYIGSLPACPPNTTLSEGSLPNCRPKGVSAEQIFNESGARETEANFVTNLPNEIIFSAKSISFNPPLKNQVSVEQEKELEPQSFSFEQARNILAGSRTAFFAALVATLISMLVLVLTWGKNFKKSLTYISWGLLGFVIFLPIGLFLFAIPRSQIVNGLNISENWEWLGAVIVSLVLSVFKPFFWQSVICIVVAIGILVLFNLVLRNKLKDPEKTS